MALEGNLIAAESVVEIMGDLEITEDGSLSVQTAMEPLGELTISTHGQGGVEYPAEAGAGAPCLENARFLRRPGNDAGVSIPETASLEPETPAG